MPGVPSGYPTGLPSVPYPSFGVTRELFRADGLTLTANGNTASTGALVTNQVNGVTTGIIDVSPAANGLLVVNVLAVSGTGTPTLAVFFDVQDFYGNWLLTSNSTSINGSGITAAGVYGGLIATSTMGLTQNGRIRWTVTGTTPSFTASLDLFGR